MRYLSHLVQDGFLGIPTIFAAVVCRIGATGISGGDKKPDWLEPESWENALPSH